MSGHKSKKRKTRDEGNGADTTKPSAVFKPRKGREHTLSIALPGSIIANAVTPQQKTALAGQVARACAVFCVDEVIIFDDGQAEIRPPERDGYTAYTDPNYFLFHVLSYLETPPQLRKTLFPMHRDLELAGALPSLDMPHHLRSDEWCPYREAVAVRRGKGDSGVYGTFLDCGLQQQVFIAMDIEENSRVTVRLPEDAGRDQDATIEAEAVSPDVPREEAGYYWGYSVRQASSLGAVFTECLYDGGYDFTIGTSERGISASSIADFGNEAYVEPTWNHLLVVFGGVAGLETALSADKELRNAGVSEAKELFDRWTNCMPGQGSRTIRTEEALWIGLTVFRTLVEARDAA